MMRVLIHRLDALDALVCAKIFGWRGKRIVDLLMYGASRFGDGYAYGLVGVLVLALDWSTARLLVPAGLLAFAVELPAQKVLKITLRRMRPCHVIPEITNLISLPDEFSFPSGHTAAAFLMATVLSHFYPPLTVGCYGLACLIGLSRVYNGVHYPGDALAGFFLGILSGRVGLLLVL